MQLSIKEACIVLGISRTTINRRMNAGTLQCSRNAEKQEGFEQVVFFTPEQLGLTDKQIEARLADDAPINDVPVNELYEGSQKPAGPRPARAPEQLPVRPAATPDPDAPRESTIERQELADLELAARYKTGDATDSMGNSFAGNKNWPSGKVSLLGPMEPVPKQRISCTAHMHPALTGGLDVPRVPKPWDDDCTERWHPGQQAKKEKMRRDVGLRRPTQQEQKQSNDIAAIATAWRHGFSR